MTLAVTPLFAFAGALIYLFLWIRVTSMRSELGVSIGDNDNLDLLQRVRQHGNCAEWFSLIMILMIVAELSGVSATYLYISGGLFLIGRLAHPFGLKKDDAAHILRYVGNGTNILATLNLLIWIAFAILG